MLMVDDVVPSSSVRSSFRENVACVVPIGTPVEDLAGE
jgi:hypothetical protein